jgi:hypothetical protein
MTDTNKQSKRFVSQLSWGLTLWGNINDEGKCSFSLKKRYKVKDTNEYKDSSVLFPEDLGALAFLLPQAMAWADDIAKHRTKGATNGAEVAPPTTPTALEDDNIPW